MKITFQEHKTYGVKSFFASTQQADVLVEKASLFSVKADISAFCIDGDPGSRPITELAIWKSFLVEVFHHDWFIFRASVLYVYFDVSCNY